MTQRSFGAAALILALLMSNAAAAQTWSNMTSISSRGWGYDPSRCIVWDGYQYLNMCWRPRLVVTPPWARFLR
jgi:hypothetical protein